MKDETKYRLQVALAVVLVVILWVACYVWLFYEVPATSE